LGLSCESLRGPLLKAGGACSASIVEGTPGTEEVGIGTDVVRPWTARPEGEAVDGIAPKGDELRLACTEASEGCMRGLWEAKVPEDSAVSGGGGYGGGGGGGAEPCLGGFPRSSASIVSKACPRSQGGGGRRGKSPTSTAECQPQRGVKCWFVRVVLLEMVEQRQPPLIRHP
jgi:hypothetical protein